MTYGLRVVGGIYSSAIEQKATASNVLALTFTKGIHQLLQLCCALDLEEDFIVVVGDLDVEVFRLLWLLRLLASW